MRGAPLSCEVAPQYHSALSDPAGKTEDGRRKARGTTKSSGIGSSSPAAAHVPWMPVPGCPGFINFGHRRLTSTRADMQWQMR
jgi:hypothetical protein